MREGERHHLPTLLKGESSLCGEKESSAVVPQREERKNRSRQKLFPLTCLCLEKHSFQSSGRRQSNIVFKTPFNIISLNQH